MTDHARSLRAASVGSYLSRAVPLAGRLQLALVSFDPAAQRPQRLDQRPAQRRRRVHDLGRGDRVHHARHQHVPLQPARRLCRHVETAVEQIIAEARAILAAAGGQR